MRTDFIFLLVAVLFGSYSCTKDGKNITVQGRVLNPVTGEGIPNVEIRLLKETSGSPGTSGGLKEVATVYSDASGNFELNHTSWFSRVVAAYPDHDIYYDMGWVENGTQLHIYKEKVNLGNFTYLDYWAVPYGGYSLDINNINCQGPNDTIIINQQNQVGSFLDIDWTLTGCNGYTTAMDKVPMGWIYLNWTVIRNGLSSSFSDQVYIGEGQEITYTLDY